MTVSIIVQGPEESALDFGTRLTNIINLSGQLLSSIQFTSDTHGRQTCNLVLLDKP